MIKKITNAITPLKHVDKINEVIDKFNAFYKRQVGEIIPVVSSASYVPEGTLPCNGTEYTKAQFNDLWDNYLAGGEKLYAYGNDYVKSEIPQVGEIVYDENGKETNKTVVEVADGYIVIQGTTSSGQTTPPEQVYRSVNNDITMTLLNTCSYSEYETDLTTYGQCVKFALDVDNEKFRVPLIKDGSVIQQALTDSELGKSYNAGLPNITAYLSSSRLINTYEDSTEIGGAFSMTTSKSDGFSGSGSSRQILNSLNFDASLSNPIYGTSDTVQPNAVALRYFVVVANGQTNQSMMDWSQWASSLQGKANIDLSNVPQSVLGLRKLVEVSDPALMPSWYKVFEEIQPDGSIKKWCEQGWSNTTGSNMTGSQTITFLKEFSDEDYVILKNHSSSSSDSTSPRYVSFYNKTTTGASTYALNAGASWLAMGYIN